MVAVTVEVDVDVDLADIDEDDLIEELEKRRVNPITAGARGDDLNDQRQAMLRALWDRDDAKAVELLKTYLCDCLGRAAI
ncbi:hypothetical protein [Orrella dioscoreae]|uniref:Uncharacterized protein n=1 Tax=Orrella dioscoreae TaxID=1851544 RepID=A0A1C3K7T7_9BURK|nr:hypothetical protein [Orrella dioscoreae]SBT27563.1 hypothetical protein ODI_02465 [Orrella dioscoreae]SOE48068.1 hypothetical protein ODI_R1216 [Orrella dioscoreae]